MATINASQDYDLINTLTFTTGSGTCKIRLYRGSSSAYSGTMYYREGTSGTWTTLSVSSGGTTTFPVSSTTMQIASDLSYGHQRLLEIAMGLAQDPELFILDEPTQGLAESEVTSFIELVKSLAGEMTILLIEHNMDVIKSSDYLIDIGPEGGINGGKIVAKGTPEEVAKNEKSYTGQYLKEQLEK
jgi:ABC-type enterochelin transport system ATPase subunit